MHSASRAGHGSYTCEPGVLRNGLLSETCKAEMASEPCRSLVLGSDKYLPFLETASVCHVRRESALQALLKGLFSLATEEPPLVLGFLLPFGSTQQ